MAEGNNHLPVPNQETLLAMATAYNAWDQDEAEKHEHEEGRYKCVGIGNDHCSGYFHLSERDFDPTPLCHACAQRYAQIFAAAIPGLMVLVANRTEALERVAQLERELADRDAVHLKAPHTSWEPPGGLKRRPRKRR